MRDALLAIDRPALPRRRGKAGISGDLSAVIELSGKSFRPKDGSELRPNAMDTQQHRRRGRRFGLFRVKQRVSLSLNSLDLLEQQFEPIKFSTNLGFEMLRAIDGHRQSEALPAAPADRDATAHTRKRPERRAIL